MDFIVYVKNVEIKKGQNNIILFFIFSYIVHRKEMFKWDYTAKNAVEQWMKLNSILLKD